MKTLKRYGGSNRPSPKIQLPLPHWDPSDGWGLVHVVQPPDLTIPDSPTRGFFKGNPFGVLLDPAPPFVNGANTTPANMTMSYLLPKYKQFGMPVIDQFLTKHAESSFDMFHLDRWQADQAGMSDSDFCDLIAYCHTWGFFTPIWFTGSGDNRGGGWSSIGARVNSFMKELLLRGQNFLDKVIALPGEELNNGCPPGPNGADSIISNVCAAMNPVGVPVQLHFTSNYPGYPENAKPGEDFDKKMVDWIAQWRGRVTGHYVQMDPYSPIAYTDPNCYNAKNGRPTRMLSSAGYMGAKLWDIRRFWARAGFTTPCITAFELMGDPQLYGNCSEQYSALRGLEMLYCTSDGSAPPLTGGCAARLQDGTALRNV